MADTDDDDSDRRACAKNGKRGLGFGGKLQASSDDVFILRILVLAARC